MGKIMKLNSLQFLFSRLDSGQPIWQKKGQINDLSALAKKLFQTFLSSSNANGLSGFFIFFFRTGQSSKTLRIKFALSRN